MEKRLPFALLLSFLILLGWSLFAKPPAARRPAANAPAPTPALASKTPETAAAGDAGDLASEVDGAGKFAPRGEVVEDGAEREIELELGRRGERGSFLATFLNRGGLLKSLRLGNWYDAVDLTPEEKADTSHWTVLIQPAKNGTTWTGSMALRSTTSSQALAHPDQPLDQALWTMEAVEEDGVVRGVEFEYAPGTGMRFVKRVLAVPGTYDLQVELEFHNDAAEIEGPVSFLFTPAEIVPVETEDNFYIAPQAIAAGRRSSDKAIEVHSVPRADKGPGAPESFGVPASPLAFAGVHNKYFAVLLRSGEDARSRASLQDAVWRRVKDDGPEAGSSARESPSWPYMATDLLIGVEVPARGGSTSLVYRVYAGPKDRSELEAHAGDHIALIDEDLHSFVPGVSSIAKLLVIVLGGIEKVTRNWGLAIILLTLCVRAALFPINRRSQTAMARYQKKIKRLQPQIEELKKRYGKDAQKLRQEQTKLMQQEGAFPPLGGCLPVFLQIPVFFGLFQALRTDIDLRHAPFVGWMNDLSKPDQLLRLDLHTGLPLIGTIEYLNILPILMVILWVLQQRMMPKPADEQAAQMQKMMMFMPVVMGFFLYSYAAGLSLYMITQSVLGMFEQTIIKKRWPIDDEELPRSGQPGFFARLAQKQLEQRKRVMAMRAARPRHARRASPGGGKKSASR